MEQPKTENVIANRQGERKTYIDLLRILSAFSVIMIHASSQYWYTLPVDSASWLVCNSYDALSRFGVPVFVMISGMLFLSKEGEIDISRLYRKNILRLVVICCVWSSAYGLARCIPFLRTHEITLKECVKQMLAGKYHLWFLPMLIAIYMIVPVLKIFTDHCTRKQIEYFLLLFFVLQIGRETLAIADLSETVSSVVGLLDVELVGGYVGYFLLGYYLYRYPLSVKKERLSYLLGAAGLVCAVVVSGYLSLRRGDGQAAVFDSFSIVTFLASTVLFVFFQNRVGKLSFSPSARRWIREISENTLGVYVMHLGILELLQARGISSMSVNNVIGIPLLAFGCFIICNIAAALLRRIPLVGRYIC
ncbi:MAG: acyltransferase family protein [Lachnospiraceae bacterium]|nr:acyltransferase family protein [Lachnospiraceae bacterium]